MAEYIFIMAKPRGYRGYGFFYTNQLEGNISDYVINLVRSECLPQFKEEINSKMSKDITSKLIGETTHIVVEANSPHSAIKKLVQLRQVFYEVGRKYSKSEKANERYGHLRFIPRTKYQPIHTADN